MNSAEQEAASVTTPAEAGLLSRSFPAEVGVWLFLFADMCIFALYFSVFLWDRGLHPEQFLQGQATLSTRLGGLNTVVLLVSSWIIARGVRQARNLELESFRRSIVFTMLCGLGFICIKIVEYGDKFTAGFHVATNTFYRDYFAFTGLHMFHVIIGLSFLGWLLLSVNTVKQVKAHIRTVEGVGLYWHMVDLLWVILFALIYLAP